MGFIAPPLFNPSVVIFLQPQPKYFQSAAILDDFMVVFGGRSNTTDGLFSHQLLVYNVKCNYWQLLSGRIVLAFHKALHSAHTPAARVWEKFPLHGGYRRKKSNRNCHRRAPSELLYSAYGKRGICGNGNEYV